MNIDKFFQLCLSGFKPLKSIFPCLQFCNSRILPTIAGYISKPSCNRPARLKLCVFCIFKLTAQHIPLLVRMFHSGLRSQYMEILA